MRKFAAFLLAGVLALSLCACGKTWTGEAGLVEKARQEIPLSDIENTDVAVAGMAKDGDKCLVWFVTGDAYQVHSYYPMEFTEKKPGEYQFEAAHEGYNCGTDKAAYPWNGGYSFLVNDPACTEVDLTMADGSEQSLSLEGVDLPAVLYVPETPAEYAFVGEGKEL